MQEKSKTVKQRNYNQANINHNITHSQIRLISSSGSQLGIVSSKEAIKLAKAEGLDLVMISDKSNPPVCKIIDYGKYKFIQEKKLKKLEKNNTTQVSKR